MFVSCDYDLSSNCRPAQGKDEARDRDYPGMEFIVDIGVKLSLFYVIPYLAPLLIVHGVLTGTCHELWKYDYQKNVYTY